jgi:hypothetical protein
VVVDLGSDAARSGRMSKEMPERRTRPGLRFDNVAVGLVEHVEAAVRDVVPDGIIVGLTVTAPIRVDSKTAAELGERIRTLLNRRSKAADFTTTIFGNGVRIRFINVDSAPAPKVIGFVHNPDTDSRLILDVAQSTCHALQHGGRRVRRKSHA